MVSNDSLNPFVRLKKAKSPSSDSSRSHGTAESEMGIEEVDCPNYIRLPLWNTAAVLRPFGFENVLDLLRSVRREVTLLVSVFRIHCCGHSGRRSKGRSVETAKSPEICRHPQKRRFKMPERQLPRYLSRSQLSCKAGKMLTWVREANASKPNYNFSNVSIIYSA